MQFPNKSLISSMPLTAVSLSLLLTLSACSMGAHSDRKDHGESGHHDGSMDDHHSGNDHHGEEVDHHESMAGVPGLAKNVTRTIEVNMDDTMAYSPSAVTVKAGETIRFTVKNSGLLVHEFVLGTHEENRKHHDLMKRFPGMEHDDPNSVSLESQDTGEVIWQFTRADTFQFACLQPGHYEAGMKGNIAVSAE